MVFVFWEDDQQMDELTFEIRTADEVSGFTHLAAMLMGAQRYSNYAQAAWCGNFSLALVMDDQCLLHMVGEEDGEMVDFLKSVIEEVIANHCFKEMGQGVLQALPPIWIEPLIIRDEID